MEDKEVFLKKNRITDKFHALEQINPNLWDSLQEIYEDYELKIENGTLKRTINNFIEVLGAPSAMHSMRYRIKTPDSLIVKIIHKMCSDFTDLDYANITKDTYGKVIMDLLGVRILLRHRYQWEEIHDLLWENYFKGTERYVKNRIDDYIDDAKEPFLAERPKVFYRYEESTKCYELKGRDTFDFEKNNPGYSSNHYIVNYFGSYIEIQVRTLFDEAWSENDHDFVYKLHAGNKKLVLNRTSNLLSKVAEIADELSMFMHDYYDESIFSVPGGRNENNKTSIIEKIPIEKYEKIPIEKFEKFPVERLDKIQIEKFEKIQIEKFHKIQEVLPENIRSENLHSRSVTSKSISDINDLY